jgi:hypothetical protein
MKIFEVAGTNSLNSDSQKLLALSQFLLGRASDETAAKEISQAAFIDLAKSLGVNVTTENLNQLINQEPLSNILEPLEPGSSVVRFRGNVEGAPGMSVDQARATVDSNAKAALKRRS